MRPSYYENSDLFIAICEQPAILFELALAQGIDPHLLLKGTRLFPEDFNQTDKFISHACLQQMLSNAINYGASSLSFQFGDRLLPGRKPELISALSHAAHLYQTFELLSATPLSINPLLQAEFIQEKEYSGLAWHDGFGLGPLLETAVESCTSSVLAWVKWQSQLNIPWRFEFSYKAPSNTHDYQVWLADKYSSEALSFNQPRNRLLVHNQYLFESWPKGSSTAFNQAYLQLQTLPQSAIQMGFCTAVAQTIEARFQLDHSLAAVAHCFSLSSSSLKRKLKQHNTNFQSLLDEARKTKAIKLLSPARFSTEELALEMGIRDVSNFRKAFKRWTGMTVKEAANSFSALSP